MLNPNEYADLIHSLVTERERQGISKRFIAEALGISRDTVDRIEDANPNVTVLNLFTYADFIGVDLLHPLSRRNT